MQHSPPQILGVGLAAPMAQGYLVRDPVVGHELRVVDGEVGGALVEIADGIAARVHGLADQFVRAADRRARIIDEIGLDHAPPLHVALGFLAAQRPDVEALDALLAISELRLRLARVAVLVDGGHVLGAVMRAHLLRSAALDDHRAARDDHERRHDDDDDCGRAHAVSPPAGARWWRAANGRSCAGFPAAPPLRKT